MDVYSRAPHSANLQELSLYRNLIPISNLSVVGRLRGRLLPGKSGVRFPLVDALCAGGVP